MPRIVVSCGDKPVTHEVWDGCTPQKFMEMLFPETGNFPLPVLCFYDDKPRLRAEWRDLCLHGDQVAVFVGLPMGGGGGSNPLSIVLTVAVMAAAAMTYGTLAGAEGLLLTALGESGAMFVGGLASGAVMAIGTMLINAIIPPVSMGQQAAINAEAASPTYNINAASNQARLGQCEPEQFGKMSVMPDRVANYWSMYINNDMYLYQVFGLGRGLSQQHSMSYAGTKFWENGRIIESAFGNDIEVEIVEPGNPVKLFPDNVESNFNVAGQTMHAPNEDEYNWCGPFAACPSGTTTREILLDLLWPKGLGRFNDSGGLGSFTVGWEFQYRVVDDFDKALSGWLPLDEGVHTEKTQTPQRLTLKCPVPECRPQVRGRRSSNTNKDNRTLDELQWGALRALLPGTLRYNQSVVAVKIKASNNLSNNASERFSVVQTRKLPLYDPATKTWSGGYNPLTGQWWGTLYPTRSFAAALAWVCKAPWGGRLTDSQIDLDTLWAIDAILQKNGWTCDAWLDGPYLVWNLIVEMCAAVQVIPQPGTGVLSFIMDSADRPIKHEFTPHNIIRGSFKPTWATFDDSTPDDVNITYLDEEAAYAQRDVTAVLPESESQEESQQRPLFIVKRAHAHAYGVRLAAGNRYRRLGVELQTEGMGRILHVGDVVSVKHPRFRSLASGILSDWDAATLNVRFADPAVLPENASDLYISFTARDGAPWGPCNLTSICSDCAVLDPVDYAALLAQGGGSPFTWFTRGYDRQPTVWSLHSSAEFARRMIIKSVTPVDMYRYRVSLVNDDPRVYNQNIPVPPWEYRPNLPEVTNLEAPRELRVEVAGNPVAPDLSVTWLPVAGANGYHVHYLGPDSGGEWQNLGISNLNRLVIPGVAPGIYRVRVSAFSESTQSAWSEVSGDTGSVPPAAPVPLLNAPYQAGQLSISWLAVPEADSYNINIYGGADASPARVLSTNSLSYTYTAALGLADGGPWRDIRAAVSAVNAAGQSEAGLVQTADPPPAEVPAVDIQYQTAANAITFSLTNTPAGEDLTGYVLARGATADFGIEGLLELRPVSELPYSWSGLEAATEYHFRLAAKDALFDLSGDYLALNYSAVISVSTEESDD